jgi:hypothetical protein
MIYKILLVLIFPSILFSFSGISINETEPFGPVPSGNQMR